METEVTKGEDRARRVMVLEEEGRHARMRRKREEESE